MVAGSSHCVAAVVGVCQHITGYGTSTIMYSMALEMTNFVVTCPGSSQAVSGEVPKGESVNLLMWPRLLLQGQQAVVGCSVFKPCGGALGSCRGNWGSSFPASPLELLHADASWLEPSCNDGVAFAVVVTSVVPTVVTADGLGSSAK